MADKEQSYSSHTRLDPPFHFFLAPIVLANLIMSVVAVVRHPAFSTGWSVVLGAAALVAVFKMRAYALKVQDRVIRLEERLRLSQLLPEPARSKICDLTESQLVAIRFCSDSEVPGLVAKSLADNLKNGEIKKAIVNWRPDYFRV